MAHCRAVAPLWRAFGRVRAFRGWEGCSPPSGPTIDNQPAGEAQPPEPAQVRENFHLFDQLAELYRANDAE
jgi:hypothetical protein